MLRQHERRTMDQSNEFERVAREKKKVDKTNAKLNARLYQAMEDLDAAQAALSECQSQLKQCESSKSDLQTELNKLDRSHQSTAHSIGTENASLKSQLQSLRQQLDTARTNEDIERRRNEDVHRQLRELEQQKEDVISKLRATESKLTQAQSSLERCQSDLSKERASFESEMASREKEQAHMKTLLKSLEASREELHVQHEALLRDSEQRLHDAQRRIQELETHLDEEIQETERMRRKENELIKSLRSAEKQVESLRDELSTRERSYQDDLQRMEQAHTILEQTLDSCRGELASLSNAAIEPDVAQTDLRAPSTPRMEHLAESRHAATVHAERETSLQTKIQQLENSTAKQVSQLHADMGRQKNVYEEVIQKLKERLQALTMAQDEYERDIQTLEKKVEDLNELVTQNAELRTKAEEERDAFHAQMKSMQHQHEADRLDLEGQHATEMEHAEAHFRELQHQFEMFRHEHENLVQVYQEQQTRLVARLRMALEKVMEMQEVHTAKEKKQAEGKKSGGSGSGNGHAASEKPGQFKSESSKARLVFDMAKLMSNLSEREAMVRNLTAEVEQYKRALNHQNTGLPSGARPISIARPLTAILTASTNAHNNTSNTVKASKGRGGHHGGGGKEKENVAPGGSGGSKDIHLNLHIEEVTAPPLTWSEERSLAVLGSELAHMELQLKHVQRLHLNEKETALHFEQLLRVAESNLEATKEKLRATTKELNQLQRTMSGTIRAQEEELNKLNAAVRSDEEWGALSKQVADSKLALKQSREELARKTKQLQLAHEDVNKLRIQLEELERSINTKESKILKWNRAIQSKDALIADLKRRLDERESVERAATESNQDANERIKLLQATIQRKEALIKDLKTRLESMIQQNETATEALETADELQKKLQLAQRECTNLQAQLDREQEERHKLEKQWRELQDEVEDIKTKAHKQAQAHKNDLAVLERETRRVGACYDSLRSLLHDFASNQVRAIEELSSTLADLERDMEASNNDRVQVTSEISVADVQSLSIAAEFSQQDLDDILSTTLRSASSSDRSSRQNRGRSADYARKILSELDEQLRAGLSAPSILALVRSQLSQLVDERVRLELLVLSAATSNDRSKSLAASSSTAPQSQYSQVRLHPSSSSMSASALTSSSGSGHGSGTSSSSFSSSSNTASRLRHLRGELDRFKPGASTSMTSSSSSSSSASTSAGANARPTRSHPRVESSPSSNNESSGLTSSSIHSDVFTRGRPRGDSSLSISSIDSTSTS